MQKTRGQTQGLRLGLGSWEHGFAIERIKEVRGKMALGVQGNPDL